MRDAAKIDLHTHIIPPSCPNWNERFGSGGWLTMAPRAPPPADGGPSAACSGEVSILNGDGSLFRNVERNCYCPATRIAECDAAGVTIQVLSTVPGIGFNYGKPAREALVVAQFLNDHIGSVVAGGSGRFIGLATVPLQDVPLAVAELERCITQLGFAGVQIGSHINGKALDDPSHDAFWRCVEALDCAVFVHPWDMAEDARLQQHWFPWLLGMPHETSVGIASMVLGGVFERFPRLRVAFAHGGGCFPGLIGRIDHGFKARPDLCQTRCTALPSSFLPRIWVDSLVHDPDMLALIIRKFGPHHVMLGSDYPFPLGDMPTPGRSIEEAAAATLGLPADASAGHLDARRQGLLWRNAAAFLKLSLHP